MTLQIFNTLTRKKEVFKPKREDNVKVYFCGPTPYNYAHIGNLKTYVFEDVVVRTLRFLGYKVTTTMNITDIEDKIIKESQKTGENYLDFTRRYAQIFLQDIEKLSVIKADNIEFISDIIPQMVEIINGLLKKQVAYKADDGSIYFSIKNFPSYGKLAHLDFSGMKTSVRINNDEYDKETAADFVLWKGYDPQRDGNIFWEAAFEVDGKKEVLKGRPGWHIECSACNLKYFGPEIDLHMGGVDLIFPHHQNEIAQSEAYSGKKFSRFWMHGGHLTVDGKKMSKSLDNFYTLRDIEQKFEKVESSVLYRAVRLSFIAGRYKDSIDFSFQKLEQQIQTIHNIDATIKKVLRAQENSTLQGVRREFSTQIQKFIQDFVQYLEDDINTPEALKVFFEFITFTNNFLSTQEYSTAELTSILDIFKTFNQIFAMMRFDFDLQLKIPQEVQELFDQRQEAKKQKDYANADVLRQQIEGKGYLIIDEKAGSRLEKK